MHLLATVPDRGTWSRHFYRNSMDPVVLQARRRTTPTNSRMVHARHSRAATRPRRVHSGVHPLSSQMRATSVAIVTTTEANSSPLFRIRCYRANSRLDYSSFGKPVSTASSSIPQSERPAEPLTGKMARGPPPDLFGRPSNRRNEGLRLRLMPWTCVASSSK
jgi:hypothetical protein